MKYSMFFLLICFNLISDELDWKKQDAYIQLSSVEIQTPVPGKGSLIRFDPADPDLRKNFETTPKRDGIVCRIPGKYLVFSAIQPATFCRGLSGYIDCWFEINGAALPGSNARQYVDEISYVAELTLITLIELKENDILSCAFSASGPNIGTIFIQSSLSSEPSVTSFALSAYKICE